MRGNAAIARPSSRLSSMWMHASGIARPASARRSIRGWGRPRRGAGGRIPRIPRLGSPLHTAGDWRRGGGRRERCKAQRRDACASRELSRTDRQRRNASSRWHLVCSFSFHRSRRRATQGFGDAAEDAGPLQGRSAPERPARAAPKPPKVHFRVPQTLGWAICAARSLFGRLAPSLASWARARIALPHGGCRLPATGRGLPCAGPPDGRSGARANRGAAYRAPSALRAPHASALGLCPEIPSPGGRARADRGARRSTPAPPLPRRGGRPRGGPANSRVVRPPSPFPNDPDSCETASEALAVMVRGPKKHLKRLNAPKHWMLDKLGGIFVRGPTARRPSCARGLAGEV